MHLRRKRPSPEPELQEHSPRRHKRPRVDSRSGTSSSCRRVILEEIDLEIGLHERLSETVQSRITWAFLLQEALQHDLPGT